jgi:protein import protein ZIM17
MIVNNIEGTRNSDSGYLVASFVCKKCETRNTKKFSKRSYKEGIVIIRCDGCKNLHLIADNLGWFEDGNVNIEDLMKRKGEEVRKISCDGLLNLVSDENVKI